MSSFKLIIHPFAEIDLQVATEWYNLQKDKLGNEFVVEVDNILKIIAENPQQFPKIKKEIKRANIIRFPFSVFYVVKSDVINVFAVFHDRRNPVIWKNRIKNKK